MKNVIIIGSGPAGVSASLYTSRSNIDTTVISNGNSALDKAEKIENYYGFKEGISGKELQENSIIGAKKLGVQFKNEEVVDLSYDGDFTVKTTNNNYKASSVIIATGSSRNVPNIEGVKEFTGKGVSYCAVCDAFFYRNKNVCVIGNGEYAISEANVLLNVALSVTILTNGEKIRQDIDNRIIVNSEKIKSVTGEEKVTSVIFENGSSISVDGVFIALGVASSFSLAKKIGAVIENNKIATDENMQTSVKGLFAAGDCVGGILQVSKAVYEGASAGLNAIKFLKEK